MNTPASNCNASAISLRKASYASTMSVMSDMEESVIVEATTATRAKAAIVNVGRKVQGLMHSSTPTEPSTDGRPPRSK
ncbi:hypothetical protein BDZ89DRAFT_1167369 [Hymenopellis radicata]|nr:hypothetical protein BDZ89DRAFT_1167369 [Hymenopellis radicata]